MPAKEDAKSQAAKRKVDGHIAEEKTKRLKAETVMQHQKSIIDELQSQISDLQEHELRALTLRQSLTAGRGTKDRPVSKPDTPLPIAASAPTLTPAEGGPGKGTSASGAKGLPVRPPPRVVPRAPLPSSSPLCCGRRPWATPSCTWPATMGCKKGMYRYVVVGTGVDVELRRIAGFSSIIVDQPLERAHPAGAPVRVYVADAKTLVGVSRLVATECVRGLLLDELLPLVETEGAQALAERGVNEVYQQRAVLTHTYTVARKPPIAAHASEFRGAAVSAGTGRAYLSLEGGAPSALDFSLNMVKLLALFEEHGRAWELTQGVGQCAHREGPQHASEVQGMLVQCVEDGHRQAQAPVGV